VQPPEPKRASISARSRTTFLRVFSNQHASEGIAVGRVKRAEGGAEVGVLVERPT
jgi:hypothetical protein